MPLRQGGKRWNTHRRTLVSLDLDVVVATEDVDRLITLVQPDSRSGGRPQRRPDVAGVRPAGAVPNRRALLGGRPGATEREVLGIRMRVAALEDVLQGKIWPRRTRRAVPASGRRIRRHCAGDRGVAGLRDRVPGHDPRAPDLVAFTAPESGTELPARRAAQRGTPDEHAATGDTRRQKTRSDIRATTRDQVAPYGAQDDSKAAVQPPVHQARRSAPRRQRPRLLPSAPVRRPDREHRPPRHQAGDDAPSPRRPCGAPWQELLRQSPTSCRRLSPYQRDGAPRTRSSAPGEAAAPAREEDARCLKQRTALLGAITATLDMAEAMEEQVSTPPSKRTPKRGTSSSKVTRNTTWPT